MEINIWIVGIILASIIIGVFIGKTHNYHQIEGLLRVNTINPDKDIFTLELTCPLGEIPRKKYVIFKVVNECSQEKHFL